MTLSKTDIDPQSSSEQDMFDASTLSGTQDVYEPAPVPSEIRGTPTNYLRVSKDGVPKPSIAIRGQYFIDLSIPPVPKSVSNVARGSENLFVHTKNGAIIADVWVTGNKKSKPVFMKLSSDDGSVRAKVHDAFSIGEKDPRPSFDIELRAPNGGISLLLPRFFCGIVTIKPSYDKIVLSPAFGERAALLSDVPDSRVYFVGDRPRSWMLWDDEQGEEGAVAETPLDKLVVNSSRSSSGVRIGWEGEQSFLEKYN